MQKTEKILGNSHEIINAGITGYGTPQETAFLSLEGLKYNPRLVILGFMLNDVPTNYLNENIFSFHGEKLAKNEKPEYRFSVQKKTISNSWLLLFQS